MIKRFAKDRSGATVVEYGLIVAVLTLAIAAGMATTGNSISNMFTNTGNRLDNSAK